MGWNTVSGTGRRHPSGDDRRGSSFYFVHSFAPDVGASTVGATDHGRTFAAAVAHDNVFATQFHPEKSGDTGLALYEAFVREVRAAKIAHSRRSTCAADAPCDSCVGTPGGDDLRR